VRCPSGRDPDGGQKRGEALGFLCPSDFYALHSAGCVAFTDDGSTLLNPSLMRRALELCSQIGVPVMNHCEDPELSAGEINEGEVSALLGISGRHPSAEDVMVARDCILSYHTGGHIHLQHLTTALSVELVRFFKEKGARVTCEVNPQRCARKGQPSPAQKGRCGGAQESTRGGNFRQPFP